MSKEALECCEGSFSMLEIVLALMSEDVIDIIGRGRLIVVSDKGRL
jgi:hypothetical protein